MVMKIIRYALIGFAIFCTALVVFGVGRGFVRGMAKQNSDANTASSTPVASGMARDEWIARFKPMEVHGLCTNSPLHRSFNGTYQQCVAAVRVLFDQCTSNVVHIPTMIETRKEAERHGAVVGECIAAHHFGGEHMMIFLLSQQRGSAI